MAGTPTSRLKLPLPSESEPCDVPTDLGLLANALDPVAAVFLQGSSAAMPTPGVPGRLYFASDIRTLFYDDGAAWQQPGYAPGDIKPSAAAAAQTGWLLCNGSAVSRTVYPALFAAIGVAYGAGDGSTTFGLPDLRGRAPVGSGQGAGLTNRALGAKGGEEIHALVIGEVPSHNHTGQTTNDLTDHTHGDAGHSHGMSNPPVNPGAAGWGSINFAAGSAGKAPSNNNYAGGGESVTAVANAQIGGASNRHTHGITAQGGGGGHNTMPPFAVVNYLIKT
jgi:microcystin-dependent protein